MSDSEGADRSFLSRYADAIAILLIVILNAVIGFVQEARAERALEALQSLAAPRARVRRGGKLIEISGVEVVPGDVLELETGDAVAADARLVQTVDLATEESALTGESVPSGKDAMAHIAADAPLGDRQTMVYTGTMVVRGRGRAVVTGTGAHTELGRIGDLIASIKEQKTPLEERLEPSWAEIILVACILAISALLMAFAFLRPSMLVKRGPRQYGAPPRRGERWPWPPSLKVCRRSRRSPSRSACSEWPETRRHRPKATRGGDARLSHHHLLGQDRNADAERDDRAAHRADRRGANSRSPARDTRRSGGIIERRDQGQGRGRRPPQARSTHLLSRSRPSATTASLDIDGRWV